MAFRPARAAEESPADCRGARQRHKPHCIRRGWSRRGSGSPGLRLFERPTIESSSAHSRAAAFRCRRRISQGNQLESHGKFYRCRKAREVSVRPLFCVADTLLRRIAVTEWPAWSGPTSQRSLIPEGQPVVLEIAVTECESAKREDQLEKS